MRTFHPDKIADEKLECQLCHAKFKRRDNLTYHKRVCEYRTTGKQVATNQIENSAPKGHRNTRAKWSEQSLQLTTDKFIINLDEIQQTPETIIDIYGFETNNQRGVEAETRIEGRYCLTCRLSSSHGPYFPDRTTSSLQKFTDIDQVLHTIIEQILKRVDEYEERGSGWLLHQLLRLDLHTYEYTPFCASTYIPLPNDLKAKEAVVNIKNKV